MRLKQTVSPDAAIVRHNDRMMRFYTSENAWALAARTGLYSIAVRKTWYPWSDLGITRQPRGHEQPWDRQVTGRR